MVRRALFMVAVLVTPEKEVFGYRLVDVNTAKVSDVPKEKLYTFMRVTDTANFSLDKQVPTLKTGKMERLPVILRESNKKKTVIDNDYVIIIAEQFMSGITRKEVVGYVVTDYSGVILELSVEEVLTYKDIGYLNGTVVPNNGKPLLQPSDTITSYLRILEGEPIPKDIVDKTNRTMEEVYPGYLEWEREQQGKTALKPKKPRVYFP